MFIANQGVTVKNIDEGNEKYAGLPRSLRLKMWKICQPNYKPRFQTKILSSPGKMDPSQMSHKLVHKEKKTV